MALPAALMAQSAAALRVNGDRIQQHLSALAKFGTNLQGGVSRVAYSDADLKGRAYAISLMKDAGLEVRIDAAGNIVGTRAGSDPSLPVLMLGSHIDSVPMGGNFDGDVGSMGAIEVSQRLKEAGITLRHPLEICIFQNEEGGTVGSEAIGEGLTEADLARLSQTGKTIRDGIRIIGGDPNRLASVRRQRGSIAAYLELHIEQGAVLDAEKIDIGVVEGIVGILHSEVTIDGFANHAGTTPMGQRRDAMLAAARFIEKVNQVVTEKPGRQVGTVGWLNAEPGAYNVVPGRVTLGLELRDLDEATFTGLFHRLEDEAATIGRMNQTTFHFSEPTVVHPALTDPALRRTIDETARRLGFTTKSMPSGAGHDAQEIARVAPAGMIFIPSAGGISHAPKEFSRAKDIENGANVLLQAALAVDK